MIKLHGYIEPEAEVDYHSLGIDPPECKQPEWYEVYLHPQRIESVFENEIGTSNIRMMSGDRWTVKEKPENVLRLIQN